MNNLRLFLPLVLFSVVPLPLALAQLIPQANWRVKFVDSQELVVDDGAGTNAIDGAVDTLWQTDWGNANTPPPHEIQVDLGGVYTITKFHYLPRQDGEASGTIKQYEFYVSDDGLHWGRAVATGSFTSNTAEKVVAIPPTVGKFVRLRALSEINGNPWTSIAELKLEGRCVTPSVKLLQPWSLYLQSSNSLVVSANACLDSGTQGRWGVQFILDGGPQNGGAQFEDYFPPFEVIFSKVRKAEHIVEARLINRAGAEISRVARPFTSDKAFRVGVGDYYVAMGDSITAGVGDTLPEDNVSKDGRQTVNPPDGAIGGYPPILNNLLTAAKGYPQTIENEARGGTTSAYGLALLPALLTEHPNARRYLILYGMNDARPWLPVPSGKGLRQGDPGYPGTFKDNVQRMLTLLYAAGKQAVLAKINIALGDSSTGPKYPDPTPALGAPSFKNTTL
jgi:lysophospholipase L1-like esterase